MAKKVDKKVSRKIDKKEAECKEISNIIISCAIEAAVISVIFILLFCKCNATMYVLLEAIIDGKIESWQFAGVLLPIMFVACTIVHLVLYIIKNNKK